MPGIALAGEDLLSGSSEEIEARRLEDELLDGFRRGDPSAFERLYSTEGPRMKSLAANLLGNTNDAEDAVQDAFLKVYRAASAFQRGSRLSTWIYRILVNSCYDALRRRKRRREEALDSGERALERPSVVSDAALRLALERSVCALPDRPRAAFLLFEVEGFSHREVGEILGIPEASSRTLVFEAKRRLQRVLWNPSSAEGARA